MIKSKKKGTCQSFETVCSKGRWHLHQSTWPTTCIQSLVKVNFCFTVFRFKPVDLRFIIKPFYEDFEMLFVQSFSQKQNAKFQGHLQVRIRFCMKWAPSSEFVSSSIPSWQILIAHAQPFRGARDLAFCLKAPLESLLVWASSEGSGETARMRRLAWTFAARIGYKYQIRLTRSK